MIVSTSHRFVYARVPKTASTSVSAALEPYRRTADRGLIGRIGRRLAPGSTHPLLVDFRAHSHWPMLAARMVMGADWFDRATRFTVVRHPFHWAQSYYRHLVRHDADPLHRAIWGAALAGGGFNAFVETLADMAPPPQLAMLVGEDGAVLAQHVVRVEALDAELEPVRAALGIAIDVPRLNVGGEAQRPIDPASARRLETLFAADMAHFGYGPGGIAGTPSLAPSAASRAIGGQLARIGAIRFSPWEPLAAQLMG